MKRGTHTRPAQQRRNIRASRDKLETLLVANFQTGAVLVTLGYAEGIYMPSHALAEVQVTDWIKAVRRNVPQPLRYIRSTERNSEGEQLIHRVVLSFLPTDIPTFGQAWGYGPVTITPIQSGQQRELSALLMGATLAVGKNPVPCQRTWTTSLNLIRF